MNTLPPEIVRLIPLFIPIVLVQLGLQAYALIDLARRPADQVKGPKWLWVVIIIPFQIFGALIYLFIARREV